MLRSRRKKYTRNKLSEAINVTPFVDVLLIVLLAFMVTAPMLSLGFDVNLPKSSQNPLPEKELKKISIIVNSSGNWLFENKVFGQANIEGIFKSFNKEKTHVLIQGDRATKYEHVISLMTALNIYGFKTISLLTEQE